jgi:hypothetical protein
MITRSLMRHLRQQIPETKKTSGSGASANDLQNMRAHAATLQPAHSQLIVRVISKTDELHVVPARRLARAAEQRLGVRVKYVLHHRKTGGAHAHLQQL